MRFVIGYASLLSEISIKRLFPDVGRIVPVEISDHARCFNSYGTLSINAELAKKASNHLAHASAILHPGTTLLGLAFELNEADYATYVRHEFRYDLKEIQVRSRDEGTMFDAIICYENVDQNIDASLVGERDILALYQKYDVTSFWHSDHLPAKIYLEHCLASARDLGEDFFDNFLDTSFVHDRHTTIRSYFEQSEIDIVAYKNRARLSEVF